jgi:hypothetical protein
MGALVNRPRIALARAVVRELGALTAVYLRTVARMLGAAAAIWRAA